MKKTLIALFALASCAMGLTLTQDDVTGYAKVQGETTADWITDFTITKEDDGDLVFSNRTIASVNSENRSVTTVAITLDASKLTAPAATSPLLTLDGTVDIGIGLTADRKATAMWDASHPTAPDYDYFTIGTALATEGSITLTLSFTNGGTSLYTPSTYDTHQGLKGSLGTITSMTLASYAVDALQAVTVYAGKGAIRDTGVHNSAVSINAAIPEPATATLSLLALAGLAARRRRH